MYERILVPTDGSNLAKKAGFEAVQLAKKLDATVIVTHIIDQKIPKAYDELEEQARQYIKIIIDNALENNVKCESSIIYGSPKFDIQTLTRKSEADCIMIGTHGNTGLTSKILGSFTENVIKTINLPIILIK